MKTHESTTCLVIGGRGFVGSAIVRAARRAGWETTAVGRRDYASAVGRRFDVVINANGNAKRFLAEREPAVDFDASLRSVVRSLVDFPCDRYALVSTVDVYEAPDREDATGEDAPIDPMRLGTYGFHKRLAEMSVMRQAPSWQVFRLGQMVGPRLRKGPVFDLLHGLPLRIATASEMPFLDTRTVARIVVDLVARGPADRVFNVCGTGSVPFDRVMALFGATDRAPVPGAPVQTYRIRTDRVRGWCEVPDSWDELGRFAATTRRT